MKRVLLTYWVFLLPVLLSAQDFTSIFLEENEADSTLTRVTISPKMMGEILNSDTEKNEDILEIISNLKSMQILSSEANGESYFQKALKVAQDHSKRFEPYLSYEDENENCQIVVRKRGGSIVELIMLMVEEDRFAIINFTGKIKPEFISTLTKSMTRKHS
ncbi:DUF4252 domain-containing protein [Bacteroides sp. 51]|uniref:DUF4252 domain-containing protein n=1 Tax=Bacteroides sp. 51 TaxID=2302938 RepID=UPI0013D0E0BF|nr:DUF4252 domain-containing protein [Bacteroides sp. 51]NDV80456.1 DUF4252 domain-containing protein [Bacteroides sp. 51]